MSRLLNLSVLSILLASFIYTLPTQGQNDKHFPEDYYGDYKGILEINSSMGIQKVPMEFWLQPTDSTDRHDYVLVYGDGEKRQERRYSLIAKNAERGQFLIDENNGILLEAQVFKNQLLCLYEVAGNLLTTFISFEEDHLLFEITVASKQNAVETKEREEGIEVISYPVFTRQSALLHKY